MEYSVVHNIFFMAPNSGLFRPDQLNSRFLCLIPRNLKLTNFVSRLLFQFYCWLCEICCFQEKLSIKSAIESCAQLNANVTENLLRVFLSESLSAASGFVSR